MTQIETLTAENLVNKFVKIECPAYRNGRKHYGVVKSLSEDGTQANVIVKGNTRITVFAIKWITAI